MKAHLLIIDQLTPNVKRLKQSDTRTLFKRVYRCWRYPGCQQVIAYQPVKGERGGAGSFFLIYFFTTQQVLAQLWLPLTPVGMVAGTKQRL